MDSHRTVFSSTVAIIIAAGVLILRTDVICGTRLDMGEWLKGISQGIIGGLLSGGALLGIYLLVTANANGADGGDWLAFAGVFFGVVFTIMGTRAIEQIKERTAQKAAIKRLRGALDVWIATVNEFPSAQNMETLADLRQQLEYIGAIGADVGRDVVATNLALHVFTFHVPAMVQKLRKIVVEMDPGAPQQVAINLVLADLRAYAQNVRMTLQADC